MDQTILNSQYHDKDDSINNSLCSDHASDNLVTEAGHDDQNHALDITETETKEETSSDISGSDHEDEQAVVDSKTATKDLVTDLNIGSYKVEDKRDPCDELLDELKKQKTHDLYCRSCTSNITQTVEIFPKGKEPFPYNKESFVLRFVIFVSFKYPYIYLPWFYNNATVSPDQSSNGSDATPKKPVRDWLRLLFVLLLILLSAFVLWVPPSPSPPVPSPSPHTNGSSVPDPQKVPENGSNPHVPGGDTPTPHVPDGDTPTPHVPDGVEGDKPIPPSTKPRENRGGLIPLFRSIYFPSRRVLSIISLLLLAILALCWPSISWKRRTKRKNVVTDKDLPNKTTIQNVEDHDLVETYCVSLSKCLTDRVRHLEEYCVRRSNRIHHKLHCCVLCCCFWNFSFADIDNMTTSAKPIDPYKELLGKRNNVILHSVVVVLSFIIFAVIPPLFYGFSFKITDKGHYGEAVVVVAASLVCVISLSFGKAYAFKMNKRNTVAVYTGIAIGASVFSFIASQQARDLLEKYDFHKKF
ncbi:unnamed protein product [Cochlearia groenlandica]